MEKNQWDLYFHNICEAVATKSSCLSRKIGAILVRDHSIISTGYNGAPRKIPHCEKERFEKDDLLANEIVSNIDYGTVWGIKDIHNTCPRRLLGFESGQGIEWCIAQHAEVNCISNAARNGVSTIGSTLYMNCVTPCKNCLGTIINAGIIEVVVDSVVLYDKYSKFIIDSSELRIREFNL